MNGLPAALAALASYRQFIICELKPSVTRAGKTDKIPVDPHKGHPINSQLPANWMTFDEANALVNAKGTNYCVGFVFTEQDDFWFLDIDQCLLPENTWNEIAMSLCHAFSGAAIEVSSSGRGLHIFGRGQAPEHGCKNASYNLEFYTHGRFVALTGTNAMGDINIDFTYLLPWLVSNYFPPTERVTEAINWTSEPVEEWKGPTDDNVLISIMLKSKSPNSIFGNKASFNDLWECNIDKLTVAFPDQFSNRDYDASSADAALAQHLAFWTGNNCDRIMRLMQQSKLIREKWSREDYLYRTILNACSRQTQWFVQKPTEILTNDDNLSTDDQNQLLQPKLIEGSVFLNATDQMKLFYGCVYVREEHKILVPGGDMLKPDQFRAHFGGFMFIMDPTNEKKSRNAWEAFTESQLIRFPRSHGTCFKPDLPPGAVITNSGRDLVNIWWPPEVMRKQGDPSLFINHIKKLIPNERDQAILMSYLAGIVQYPGIKFQWAPVIQGTPGNGKSLINQCVAYAVGEQYSYFPRASEIGDKYDAWLYKHIFIGVDDMYVPGHQREIVEILKPWITQKRLPVRAMYSGPIMRDICCNFIFNCNDKAGVPKDRDDRRFAPFYTAQQTKEDLLRDGMTNGYFTRLHDWLDNYDGFAIIAHYLNSFNIPDEFNPAKTEFAPVTSSTEAAISYGMGNVEQHILEAVNQDTPGFKNGWISSIAMDRLLERLNLHLKIPLSRRRPILQALDYDWHPGLLDGRVNNNVMPDGGKPRLFVHKDNADIRLSDTKEIEGAYMDAQK